MSLYEINLQREILREKKCRDFSRFSQIYGRKKYRTV